MTITKVIRAGLEAGSIATLTLLAGCGGGGAASNVGSTPMPPAVAYTTLANATASTTLGTKGAVLESERPNSAPTPTIRSGTTNVEISYDPANRTYTLRGTPAIGSTTRIEQSFGPADEEAGPPSGRYNKPAISSDKIRFSRLDVRNPATFTYVNFGVWTVGSSIDEKFDYVYFTYGIATQPSDIPKSGSATYTLSVDGRGSGAAVNGRGAMSANFAANTVSVSLETQFFYRPEQVFSPFATLTGSGAISANGFSTQLSGNGYTGSLDGLFYGPAAVEVGAALTIAKDGGVVAVGAVTGKKD